MINLSEDISTEFFEEVKIIIQSLEKCIQYVNIEEEKLLFQNFINKSFINKVFEEEEYLLIADSIINKIHQYIDNLTVIYLMVDLSRINSDVSAFYVKYNISFVIAETIAQNFHYFLTSFNEVMIDDYLYSHYYWQAKKIIDKDNIDNLLNYLYEIPIDSPSMKENIIASILSSFMSIYFSNEKLILEKILIKFHYIESVKKKIIRLIS